jgi:hypothetical protein
MSIAQAQAMKKARLDIEELQRQVAALTARVKALEAGRPISWVFDNIEPPKGSVTTRAKYTQVVEPPQFDPDLIYKITPEDNGPPIFRPEAIVSANIAPPPKKRGRPPKA